MAVGHVEAGWNIRGQIKCKREMICAGLDPLVRTPREIFVINRQGQTKKFSAFPVRGVALASLDSYLGFLFPGYDYVQLCS